MGLLDYFKVNSSNDKDDASSIKLPNAFRDSNNPNNEPIIDYGLVGGRFSGDSDDELDIEGDIVEKNSCITIEKIQNPKQMMEILLVVRDSILDYLPLYELVELQLNCKYFNELVDSFFQTRSSLWWSGCWKRSFNYMHGPHAKANRFKFGTIYSRTENTSTFNFFYASSLSIEEEKKEYPFVLEGSDGVALVKEEEEKSSATLKVNRYNYKELQGQFIGKETQNEIIKISKRKAASLLNNSGILTKYTSMGYSSTGKSGSANGDFDKQFLHYKVKSNHFEEQQRSRGQSNLVTHANRSLRFIFWAIFNKWWLKNKSKEQKLIAHASTIKRSRLASYDRYGPVHRTETIEIFSLVHQVEGKPDVVIGTYSKHNSYYA